jgi:hypothetical protein
MVVVRWGLDILQLVTKMSKYFSNEKQAFYDTQLFDKSKLPTDAQPITEQQHKTIHESLNAGKRVLLTEGNLDTSPQYISPLGERLWRDDELSRADVELYKVQDSDPKSTGSVSEWRNYRKELRAWPEHKDFPNKEFRPKAPDAE